MTSTYEDEIIASGGSDGAGGSDDLLAVNGSFVAEITALEPFMGTKFQSDEPQEKLRVHFTTVDDPANNGWVGYRCDKIYTFTKNLANDKADLHRLYKAATGTTPQPGVNYPLKRDLIGRRVKLEVSTRVSSTGNTWPRVDTVLPFLAAPPPPPGRRAAPKDGLPADPLAGT